MIYPYIKHRAEWNIWLIPHSENQRVLGRIQRDMYFPDCCTLSRWPLHPNWARPWALNGPWRNLHRISHHSPSPVRNPNQSQPRSLGPRLIRIFVVNAFKHCHFFHSDVWFEEKIIAGWLYLSTCIPYQATRLAWWSWPSRSQDDCVELCLIGGIRPRIHFHLPPYRTARCSATIVHQG